MCKRAIFATKIERPINVPPQNQQTTLTRVIAIVLQLVDHLLIVAIEAEELVQVLCLEGWPAALEVFTV